MWESVKDWATKGLSVHLSWGDQDLGKLDVPAWVMVGGYYFYQGGWKAVADAVHKYLT